MTTPISFGPMPPERALEIDRLTRLGYELRENRKRLLARYGVEDEAALLGRIRSGALAEHPAYEHYLSARVLEASRLSLRAQLAALLAEGRRG